MVLFEQRSTLPFSLCHSPCESVGETKKPCLVISKRVILAGPSGRPHCDGITFRGQRFHILPDGRNSKYRRSRELAGLRWRVGEQGVRRRDGRTVFHQMDKRRNTHTEGVGGSGLLTLA